MWTERAWPRWSWRRRCPAAPWPGLSHVRAFLHFNYANNEKINPSSLDLKSVYLAIQQSEFIRAQRHVSSTITSLDVKTAVSSGVYLKSLAVSQSAIRGGGAFRSSRPQQQRKANESRRSKDNERQTDSAAGIGNSVYFLWITPHTFKDYVIKCAVLKINQH